MLSARSATVALLFVAALPALAARERFIVRNNGQELSGAEVCLFQAGDDSDPFMLHLSGNEIRCLPADRVIDIPPGKWFFYGRRGDDLVSAQVTTLTNRGTRSAPDTYSEVQIDLRPAATLDFAKANESRADDSFAIYLTNEGTE